MVMTAIEPSCHLTRSRLHLSFLSWLLCSQSFSMSATYCKCAVKDFVLGWERCMKIFNFVKVLGLTKKGSKLRSKWSWKLLSRVVTSWGAVFICRFSRFFRDCPWLLCSEAFSVVAASCKCVVKDFVFGWDRCMKIFNFDNVWGLTKKRSKFRSKWS